MRQVVAVILYPVQRAVEMPGEALSWVAAYFASKRTLTDENASLLKELVAQTRAGAFVPTNDAADCAYCDYMTICRVARSGRNIISTATSLVT